MRICLITAHHVSFQPRTLREADSLSEAGHDVRVVCRKTDPALTEYDRTIMKTRRWRLQPIDLQREGDSSAAWLIEGLRAKTYRKLFDIGLRTPAIGLRSYVRGFDDLVELALSEPADWFIAHTQAALPIAAAAAAHWNAGLGFDCEDLLAENGTDPVDIIECIQSEYLPLCDYVSAPSKCVGRRLTEKYRIDSPLILYNVSPTYLAAGMTSPVARAERPTVRLYWSGQTIGEGRGIEEAITALGIMATEPVELHLRGRLGSDFRSRIEGLARDAGVLDKLFIHGIVPPQDFIRTMAQFDVGLALERADHGNYSLTATNKLFGYLLAGLAVAATDTSGHRELMEQIPAAGFLYQAGNPAALAVGLRRWISERDSLCATKRAAWDAARIHFCWDIEKEKLFQLLESPRSNRLTQTA